MAARRARNGIIALLLVSAAAISLAWPWLSTGGYAGLEPAGGTTALRSLRLIVFPAIAVVCLASAWRLTRTAASREAPQVMRFGRLASPPARSGGAGVLLPLLAVLLLVGGDFTLFGRMPAAPEQVASTPGEAEPEALAATEYPPQASPEQAAQETITPPQQDVAALPTEAAKEVALPAPSQSVAPPPQPVVPEPPAPGGHTDGIDWLAVAPDGLTFMTASIDHTVKLWDLPGRRLIRDVGIHRDMARAALYLPDGEHALTAADDGEIVLRRLSDAAVVHVFSAADHGSVRALALSPDGRRVVSSHEAGTVIVWDLEKRSALHVFSGHRWPVNGIAVSPDGKRAVSGDIDGELRLWGIEAGTQLGQWKGHERGTYGAAFLPDGRLVTGSGDATIKIWNAAEGRELLRLEGHSGTVYAIAVSADGRFVLSGSLDGTARLWDIESGRETEQFVTPGGGRVYAVAFGPEGTVLTAGDGGAIRVWPARRGDEVAVIRGGK